MENNIIDNTEVVHDPVAGVNLTPINNDRLINLSFDDNRIKISRVDDRTIVTLISYFRADKLCKFMNYLGYTNMPDVVTNTLKKYGYVYDYKLSGYATRTRGITILDSRDENNQEAANNIATTKAKVKAYDRAYRCFSAICKSIEKTHELFMNSSLDFYDLYINENDALDRVVVTGYCNPDKQ